jgi:hypothetical protein
VHADLVGNSTKRVARARLPSPAQLRGLPRGPGLVPGATVARPRHAQGMTDPQVMAEEAAEGFELVERTSTGVAAVRWARGYDDRWPCFLEERQVISWMRDRLTRGRVFVQEAP